MRTTILVGMLTIGLLLMPTVAQADEYDGWGEIRPLLLDGEGSEFVERIDGLGSSAFSTVGEAIAWVANNITYVADDGEVWTSSNQTWTKGEGDCEDYAILLTALLRFHTQGGIPPNRVWVMAGLITLPGTDEVVVGHAWVGFKLERGGMAYIEPQTGTVFRGSLGGGMLQFNDRWVKGGGYFLHSPVL